MEVIYFLLLVLIITLLLIFKKDLFKRVNDLERQLGVLQSLIREQNLIKGVPATSPVVKSQIETLDTPVEKIERTVAKDTVPSFEEKSQRENSSWRRSGCALACG